MAVAKIRFLVEKDENNAGTIEFDEEKQAVTVTHDDPVLVRAIKRNFKKLSLVHIGRDPQYEVHTFIGAGGLGNIELFNLRCSELWGDLDLWVDWPNSIVPG